MIKALSPTEQMLSIGGLWLIDVETRTLDGYLTDGDAVTVVVTLPGGSTASPAADRVSTGVYRVAYTVGSSGRYVARATTTTDAVDFAAYATGTTAGTGMPTTDDVAEYIRSTSFSEAELQDALNAEAAAQRARCRIGAVYPDDLRQALLRRTMRNLHMRNSPLALLVDRDTGGANYLSGSDPEVKRLEAPYRRLVVG